jgi:hypothetical protein
MGLTRRQCEDQIRRADALLHAVTLDVLQRTAALLALIATGKVHPSTAAIAAQDLGRLLQAMTEAERVGDILRASRTTSARAARKSRHLTH